jgi:excinuclease ABC subunit A
VKLASELSRRATGKTLYLIDEPTTGLSFYDVHHLLNVLQRLVDKGNSILVIEHNLDVIRCSDWVIDLGPEGGDKGGEVIAVGTPEEVAENERSYTGQYLKQVLQQHPCRGDFYQQSMLFHSSLLSTHPSCQYQPLSHSSCSGQKCDRFSLYTSM